MKNLSAKVILITGGSKGIGATIARQAAGAGAKVVVNYSSGAQDAEDVVSSIKSEGGEAISIKAA